MNTYPETLQTAIELKQNVATALLDGNSEDAILYNQQADTLIHSIPFDKLSQEELVSLEAGLIHIDTINRELSQFSTELRDAIAKELGSFRKSKKGALLYHQIDKQ
jgi:hypothetical protein